MASKSESVRAVASEGVILVHVPYEPTLVALARTLPQRRWDRSARTWRLPDSPAAREAVLRVFRVEVEDLDPPKDRVRGPERGLGNPQALLVRFEEEMRLRGYATRTRKAYLGHARRFLREVGDAYPLASRAAQRAPAELARPRAAPRRPAPRSDPGLRSHRGRAHPDQRFASVPFVFDQSLPDAFDD